MAFYNPKVALGPNSNKSVHQQVTAAFNEKQTLNDALLKLSQGKITHDHPDASPLGTHTLKHDQYKEYVPPKAPAPMKGTSQENFEQYSNQSHLFQEVPVMDIASSQQQDTSSFIKHSSTDAFASYPFGPALPSIQGVASRAGPQSLPQDQEGLTQSLAQQGRTLNTPPVPLPAGQMPGPSYNAGLYTGPMCSGPQCNGPVRPTQNNYFYVSTSHLTPGQQKLLPYQTPYSNRLGNSTDIDLPALIKYIPNNSTGPYNIVFTK
jgi:hypothetical protein